MKSSVKIPVSCLKNPVHFLALGFGSGLAPKAPGTFGTLAAIPVYLVFAYLPLMPYLLAVVLMSVMGVSICHYTSSTLRIHDHPAIVFDEIVGYLITMFALPYSVFWLLTGFVMFRIFDIVKPWPISWFDRHVKGGLGIMLDDILAGVMACLCLHGLKMVIG